ncbi:hypothetical protein AUR04nite_03380 [Glutamicibacter uratoxydans]|uniref:Uncharacterized protein n=1 Tax=Glutamicibacter uratoxydans TaxID=43667 RepID=A0A4Y4DIM5_GLUUR|nr:hypothetical protein [Glutamicibacter uratoxydans]GED04806.1 hypothetical protein AUR04nite_03380 [Glutamicibacter uratoxydans]
MSMHRGIVVNDVDYPMFLLLYVREIKSLANDIQLPALHPAPGPEQLLPAAEEHVHALSAMWRRLWLQAWSASSGEAAAVPGTNQKSEPFSQAMADGEPTPWLWPSGSPEEAVNMAAFEQWYDQVLSQRRLVNWRSLGAVMDQAFDAGLETVYVLPLEGFYQFKVNRRCLVVSAQVLGRQEWLERALRQWLASE